MKEIHALAKEYRKAGTAESKKSIGMRLLRAFDFDFTTTSAGTHCQGKIDDVRFDFWPASYTLHVTCLIFSGQRKTFTGFNNVYSTLLKIRQFLDTEDDSFTIDDL